MGSRALRAQVHGLVQGVGFRWFVLQRARELGVRGHARNLPDGSVEVVAVGRPQQLDELVQHLQVGSRASRVDAVDCQTLAPQPLYDDFEIRG